MSAMCCRLPLRLAAAALSIVLLSACAAYRDSDDDSATQPPTMLSVHLVRHAEKTSDDPKDPGLTDTGVLRAERLAALLRDDAVVAVYATGYRRTQATAAPTATARGLVVRTYDAAQPAADFAAQLRREHKHGALLVVGHSNTVASIASALCRCEVSPLREDEFDRWITVRIGRNDAATLQTRRY